MVDTHQRERICRGPASMRGEASAHPGRAERSLEAEEKEDLEEPAPSSGPETALTEEVESKSAE